MKKIIKIIVVIVILIGGIGFAITRYSEDDRENVLIIGLDDSFPPMAFRDDNNELVGFDIDLAKAVCEELGIEVEFQTISWAEKDQELASGKIDCIWNGFAYTEERAETMTLSDIYITGESYFIVKNGTTIESQEDLIGKKIGVQNGSVQQTDLEESEFGETVECIEYSDFLTAFMDLDVGGIDAVYCSSLIGNYLITSQNKDYITISSENISTVSGCVIAFKQGNTELRDKIQNAFNKLLEEGKLDSISIKWFGTNMLERMGD